MSAAADKLTSETAAEYLRLALPLMSKQRVSTTPENYAVWYSYVSGENADLNAEIDRLIAEKQPFTEAVCAELYQEFVAEHGASKIEQVREQLNRILSEVGLSLDEAGSGARAFEGKLGGLVDGVAENNDLSDIRQMLQTLIIETRSMQDAAQGMRSQFESKSKEIEELREQLQRERRRANTDPLTGLYNRFALFEAMNKAIAEMPNDAPPSVVMLDIDRFKLVNDTHGHLIGDRVIRFVAQVLEKNIKGKDSAARYGGEEFTVLLPETPGGGARAVAESIRKAVESAQLVRADNKQPLGQITISAGVATFQAGEDVMEFVNRADQALYRSKREGRNRVSVA